MRKVEILAPAGSYEGMAAAVNAGCDAVYIGGSRFGARAFADNLTKEELLRAIDFVHLREKKLYLTVNTLLKEEELKEELYSYLLPFYEQGLDAVIVQDMGVMSFLHRNFPKLPIHASTQMTLTGSLGANGLKGFGVTRFVPARELSLKELQNIRKETDLEIEVFVHGALCFCYSGQCLLSSIIGGRSGNRGRCAQPCRMKYHLEDGKSGYFMSPKDICTLEFLPELIEAGIDSFKIEGRMKRPEYGAYTAFLYGKYADLYGELGREGYRDYLERHQKELLADKGALMDLYNRGGFSEGYFHQYHGRSMMSLRRPNHSGVEVGRVSRAGKKQAAVRLAQAVYPQDILEFRDEKEQAVYEYTLKAEAMSGSEITTNILPGSQIYNGMSVFRTKNQSLLTEISRSYLEEKPVAIAGALKVVEGEPAELILIWKGMQGTETKVRAVSEKVQRAKNQPMTEESLRRAVMQLSGSGFFLEELQIEKKGQVFFPVGKLKELRREALERLRDAVCEPYRRKGLWEVVSLGRGLNLPGAEKAEEKGLPPYSIDTLVITREQAEAAVHSLADRIYLTGELYRECRMQGLDFGKIEVVIALPYILRNNNRERTLREISDLLEEENSSLGFLVRNLDELFYLKEKNRSAGAVIADSNLYAFNQEAKVVYHSWGVSELTEAVELNQKELSGTGCQGNTLLVYGHMPLMITAQCMVDNLYGCSHRETFQKLYDRKDKELLLYNCCRDCCNIIYNGEALSLLKEKKAIDALKPKRLRLDFTIEKKEETEQVLKTFIQVFRFNQGKMTLDKETTKGHFRKGID